MRDFTGKAAFVTGGASGVGLALARALAEAGCRVMITDIEQAALDAAVQSLADVGPELRGVVCDVADPVSVDRAAEQAIAAFGKIHILCNNAGVYASSGIDNLLLDSWRWVLDVNLMGVVHGLRTFLPHMRAHGESGHIVNTASLAGMIRPLGFSPYAASKFAVVAMSEGLAAEVKPLGISVTVLCPGFVRTQIAEAGRNRPERYGPSTAATPLAARFVERVRGGIDPQTVAAKVLSAIRDNELYAFTDPEFHEAVQERFTEILAAYDRQIGR
jgi:NAD(P)-dependent dehydrogenase (short-subunit alcohol dehydrogenase family)